MKKLNWFREICCKILAFGAILAGASAGAADIQNPASILEYDGREVAMLPRYCAYTQAFRDRVPGGNNKGEIERWYSTMGETFHAMHHYCWGLMKSNRAVSAGSPQLRSSYLRDSIAEFDYVIEHAPPDFVLLPEFLTKKGENLIRLGLAPQGMPVLQRAIELKPNYWPPYAAISDYYKDAGDLAKAREVLEKGLSAAPDTNALKRRLAELDTAKDKRVAAPSRRAPAAPSPERN